MRQLNQNGGIASLPEIDVYSTALSVPDGLDKEDTLGHVDDQEGEGIIGSACVEICGGEVGGEESSAQLSPEIRVQGLVEGLNAEEANLEITDADITESALAAFSGYPVALRAHLDELQVIASCSEESPSDEQCEDDTKIWIAATEASAARAQCMALYKIEELPEENVELPMDNVLRGWRAAKVPLRILLGEDVVGKLAPMTTIE
jgi:hypothetical protein